MITDNDLLLYHYDDGLDAAERERIESALQTQPELAGRLRALVALLDSAAAVRDVPVPSQFAERWSSTLERAERNEKLLTQRSRLNGNTWAWGTVAATCVVAVAISIGWRLGANSRHDNTVPTTQVATAISPANRDRDFRWHLAVAERQLTEIGAASNSERRQLIDAVIAQNRLYAAAAERAGDETLARALRSFTPILESLALNGSDSSGSAGQLAQLNFELRVMQARLAAEASSSPAAQSLAL
jgi:tellurite resistance protein